MAPSGDLVKAQGPFARTLPALRSLGILLGVMPLVLAGCKPVPVPASPAHRAPPPVPVVRRGSVSPAQEAAADTLLQAAREALRTGRPGAARRTAAEVVASYPSTAASGPALLLESRAALAMGAFAAADSAAQRYLGLLGPSDPRKGEAALLRAEAKDSLGDGSAALESLLDVGSASPPEVVLRAVTMGRAVAADLGEKALARVAAHLPAGTPVAPVVSARYAVVLLEAGGADAQARRWAREALATGATGPDAAAARAVLRGETPPGPAAGTLRLGLVLPVTGPPAIHAVGSLIEEGVEVAVAQAEGQGIQVQVETRDDQGDPAGAAAAVRDLQSGGAIGALGFLEDPMLLAASQSRTGPFPLVSPTARLGAGAPSGVYSLESGDPGAAVKIAQYAVGAGIQRVAIIHSRSPGSVAEADAFTTAADSLGLPVVGDFAYDVGATSFGPQILGAADSLRAREIAALHLGPDDTLHADSLTPVAVFIPAPREDIQYVAPEVLFYGLDTLAIQVLGTDGWTDPRVLANTDPHYTDGVVATAPVDAGPGSPAYARFTAAYEAQFRRSLVSPIPALGYDAARLILGAIEQGARTPGQVEEALARLRDFPGATGILSVEHGALVRRTSVVRLDHGAYVPVR